MVGDPHRTPVGARHGLAPPMMPTPAFADAVGAPTGAAASMHRYARRGEAMASPLRKIQPNSFAGARVGAPRLKGEGQEDPREISGLNALVAWPLLGGVGQRRAKFGSRMAVALGHARATACKTGSVTFPYA